MRDKPQAKPRPKLKIRLRAGEDPRAWDVETEEVVTDQVQEIRILPGKKATAIMLGQNDRQDPSGEDYVELPRSEADIVRIEGIWEAGRAL